MSCWRRQLPRSSARYCTSIVAAAVRTCVLCAVLNPPLCMQEGANLDELVTPEVRRPGVQKLCWSCGLLPAQRMPCSWYPLH